MTTIDPLAQEIYQHLFDDMLVAYQENDFGTFCELVQLPQTVMCLGPSIELKTTDDLRCLFDSIRGRLNLLGATDYVRTCISVHFTSANEIIGTHEARLMLGHRVVEEPTVVKTRLKKTDGRWRVHETDNGVDYETGMGLALKQTSHALGQETPSETSEHQSRPGLHTKENTR